LIKLIQNALFPVKIYEYNLKSPLKLSQGYLNVAGTFFSKKKCPIHEIPYPITKTNSKLPKLKANNIVLKSWIIASVNPMK
jgi:hypothetical protein